MLDLRRNFMGLQNVVLVILNGIIFSSVFSSEVKAAIVKPLYKGGTPAMVDCYHPIFILFCMGQILEKHILDTITTFFLSFYI